MLPQLINKKSKTIKDYLLENKKQSIIKIKWFIKK